MIHIYTHLACLSHLTGPDHVERPARLSAVMNALEAAHPGLDWQQAPRATRGQLLRVHDESLLETVLETHPTGLIYLDPDTLLSPDSAEAALHAAGAGVAAVDAVMSNQTHRAFCAVRPPGHHATADAAMGFCLFNNVAVAASHALEAHGLERVAIIDFDVHHGNGTQAIFAQDPRVLFISSHQYPLYPGTGARTEKGCGNIVNAPLPEGADGSKFRAVWQNDLLPILADFKPQLILISAGFDAHRRDPTAGLLLEANDFAWLTQQLVRLADQHCAGRIVSLLEGGYDLTGLAESCLAHVDALCY